MDGYTHILLLVSVLMIVSILSTLFSFRAGAPILLVFLVVGLLAGEDGIGGIQFNDAHTAYVIGCIALAIILFDAGFSTPWQMFKLAAKPALILASFGGILSAGFLGVIAHYFVGLDWWLALLLGAILSSTDAAAVFFLLRVGGITLRERVRATLEVESGTNDPVAIFLTLAIVSILTTHAQTFDAVWLLKGFLQTMGLGLLCGVLGSYAMLAVVNRIDLDSGLYAILVMVWVLALFALTHVLGGSGFLAVYVAGLISAKRGMRRMHELKRFQQGLTWLAQIAMFVTLGLLAVPSQFINILIPGSILGLVLIFVIRPVVVFLCLWPLRMSFSENIFIGLVGLRGAVSILLAIVPLVAHVAGAELIFNLAFMMVLVSLIVQGWGLKPLARALGLVLPERLGVVERIQLDLPSEAAHELVAYKLHADSPLLTQHNWPRWVRPALVVRDGQSIRSMRLERLRTGDVIYVFVRPHRIPLLDRLFASPRHLDHNDREFWGDFTIDPTLSVCELIAIYNADIRETKQNLTIGEFLKSEFGQSIEIGDRISLGLVELIVRELNAQREVTDVGLTLRCK